MQVVLCACNHKQATRAMYSRPISRSALLPAIFVGAIFVFAVRPCAASIVVPDAAGLSSNDFEFLSSNQASSSPAPTSSDDSEPADNFQKSDPWDFLKALGPGGSTTSSSSTSSGGASGASWGLCVLADTEICGDDSNCGRLAEDRSLFLPDPPGTDLLRPPRCA
jgi:hypothetical protein